MKKHGCLWWLLIGWWWAPIVWILRAIFSPKKVQPVTQQRVPRPNAPAPKPVASQRTRDTETHKVAGTSYRQEAIRALGLKNEDFHMTKKVLQQNGRTYESIHEYEFFPQQVELVPEPTNPHDPNAIMVIVDGTHIGYIKAGSCAHVHKLLREDRIEKIRCKLGGGRRKMLVIDDYNDDGSEHYTMEQDSIPFYAQLKITLKSED